MTRTRQSGLVLPVFALLLMIGAIGLGVSLYQRTFASQIQMRATTAVRLAEARSLLRRYAQSYQYSHPATGVPGFLPCPDTDGDGSSDLGCGNADTLVVGLLPYRTLGSPPLRDGGGECLWYAVSSHFKNATANTALMNWDTRGQIAAIPADEIATAPVLDGVDRAAAVVMAPGPARTGQNRPPRGQRPCVAAGNTSTLLAAYLESDFSTPDAAQLNLLNDTADSDQTNDVLLALAPREIFSQRFVQRRDFSQDVVALMLNYVHSELSTAPTSMLPPPDEAVQIGDVERGRLPSAMIANAAGDAGQRLLHWRDQFVYLRCIASVSDACMSTNNGNVCRGIVLFAGSALPTQDRASGNFNAYFEANTTALALPEGALFMGQPTFDSTRPHLDVVLCL